MRIVLDHCVDWRVARLIEGHDVVTARRMGWDRLQNGDLVRAAEAEGFDALVSVDKNLRYQQNILGRRIAVVVLQPLIVDLPHLTLLAPELTIALDNLTPGTFLVVGPRR